MAGIGSVRALKPQGRVVLCSIIYLIGCRVRCIRVGRRALSCVTLLVRWMIYTIHSGVVSKLHYHCLFNMLTVCFHFEPPNSCLNPSFLPPVRPPAQSQDPRNQPHPPSQAQPSTTMTTIISTSTRSKRSPNPTTPYSVFARTSRRSYGNE
jgi:hypothetical protein